MAEHHTSEEELTQQARDNGDSCINPVLESSKTVRVDDHEHTVQYFYGRGLTKREYFASMAMQGIAMQYVQGGDFMETHIAKGAVLMADALLKELASDGKRSKTERIADWVRKVNDGDSSIDGAFIEIEAICNE